MALARTSSGNEIIIEVVVLIIEEKIVVDQNEDLKKKLDQGINLRGEITDLRTETTNLRTGIIKRSLLTTIERNVKKGAMPKTVLKSQQVIKIDEAEETAITVTKIEDLEIIIIERTVDVRMEEIRKMEVIKTAVEIRNNYQLPVQADRK